MHRPVHPKSLDWSTRVKVTAVPAKPSAAEHAQAMQAVRRNIHATPTDPAMTVYMVYLKATQRTCCRLPSALDLSGAQSALCSSITADLFMPAAPRLRKGPARYLASYQVPAMLESTTRSTSRGFVPRKGRSMWATTSSFARSALSAGPSRITSSCTCSRAGSPHYAQPPLSPGALLTAEVHHACTMARLALPASSARRSRTTAACNRCRVQPPQLELL